MFPLESTWRSSGGRGRAVQARIIADRKTNAQQRKAQQAWVGSSANKLPALGCDSLPILTTKDFPLAESKGEAVKRARG